MNMRTSLVSKSVVGLGLLSLMGLGLLGCEVESTQDEGQGASSSAEGGACPSFLVLTQTDYSSTNVALLTPEGKVASESLISSASADPGLTTPLSGDVLSPNQRSGDGAVVLIDRYPNSVLTWVDPSDASVLGQLHVGTGFSSNPYDYLQVSDTKAYVSRYESNAVLDDGVRSWTPLRDSPGFAPGSLFTLPRGGETACEASSSPRAGEGSRKLSGAPWTGGGHDPSGSALPRRAPSSA